MVLMLKVSARLAAESWDGDFSGWRMPGTVRARRRWWVLGGKRVLASAAAEAIEDSSEDDVSMAEDAS